LTIAGEERYEIPRRVKDARLIDARRERVRDEPDGGDLLTGRVPIEKEVLPAILLGEAN